METASLSLLKASCCCLWLLSPNAIWPCVPNVVFVGVEVICLQDVGPDDRVRHFSHAEDPLKGTSKTDIKGAGAAAKSVNRSSCVENTVE